MVRFAFCPADADLIDPWLQVVNIIKLLRKACCSQAIVKHLALVKNLLAKSNDAQLG